MVLMRHARGYRQIDKKGRCLFAVVVLDTLISLTFAFISAMTAGYCSGLVQIVTYLWFLAELGNQQHGTKRQKETKKMSEKKKHGRAAEKTNTAGRGIS